MNDATDLSVDDDAVLRRLAALTLKSDSTAGPPDSEQTVEEEPFPLYRCVIVHEPNMQAHVPPDSRAQESVLKISELPQRIVAIESVLRGFAFDSLEAAVSTTKLDKAGQFVSYDSPHKACRKPSQETWMSPIKGDGAASVEETREKAAQAASELALCDLYQEGVGKCYAMYQEFLRHWKAALHGNPVPGSLWSHCRIVQAPFASLHDLLRVHSESHLRNFAKNVLMCSLAGEVSFRDPCDSDLFYSPGTYGATMLAAGGAIEAVKALFVNDDDDKGPIRQRTSFAIVRPPGHHCSGDHPAGFCFMSNTALAAKYAREVLKLERVAIVDTDYHPGDGTQSIFYADASVLTISLHVAARLHHPANILLDWNKRHWTPALQGPENNSWPARRDKGVAYMGAGEGVGANINVPWPHEYVDDADYEEAMQTIVVPALRAFKPQLILWACGFDAVQGDTLAGTLLSPSFYWRIGRHLCTSIRGVPVACILEGGYSPELISLAAENTVRALAGCDAPSGRNKRAPPAGVSTRKAKKETSSVMEPSEALRWVSDKWESQSLRDLAPELRHYERNHMHPFNGTSAKEGIIGVKMREPRATLPRPEGVMEHLRCHLNRLPFWQQLAKDVGVERIFDSVGDEALLAEGRMFDEFLERTSLAVYDEEHVKRSLV